MRIKTYVSTGKAAPLFPVALLVLVVAGAAVYGMYSWQQSKIDKNSQQVTGLNRQITTLNQQIVELNTQLQAAKQNLQPSTAHVSAKGVKINVWLPIKDSKLTSPLIVVGQVPGNWSFEASFPIQLKDGQGNVIAHAPAQLLGDWMTDQLVPFTIKLEYPSTATGSGSLVLQKDNPSGLSQNDDSLVIPIKF